MGAVLSPFTGGGGFTPVIADQLVESGNIVFPSSAGAWEQLVYAVSGDPVQQAVTAAVGHRIWASSDGLRTIGGAFDYAVIVGGTPVRYFASMNATPTTDGNVGWYSGGENFSTFAGVPGRRGFVATADDLDAGTVTIGLFANATGTGGIVAGANDTFYWSVENIGPTSDNTTQK